MRACNKQRSKIPLGTKGRTSILSVESSASCGASFPVGREKTARPRMFRHFVPSRWLHPLAPLKRLPPVDLPSANSMKCCSPPASLEKQIPKIRPLTGRNVRKVDGLFLSPKSKKEVCLFSLYRSVNRIA